MSSLRAHAFDGLRAAQEDVRGLKRNGFRLENDPMWRPGPVSPAFEPSICCLRVGISCQRWSGRRLVTGRADYVCLQRGLTRFRLANSLRMLVGLTGLRRAVRTEQRQPSWFCGPARTTDRRYEARCVSRTLKEESCRRPLYRRSCARDGGLLAVQRRSHGGRR
jgi:hypothetical protein